MWRWFWILALVMGCPRQVVVRNTWEVICLDAPYPPAKRLSPSVILALQQEGVVEQRGWIATGKFVNDQCEVFGLMGK